MHSVFVVHMYHIVIYTYYRVLYYVSAPGDPDAAVFRNITISDLRSRPSSEISSSESFRSHAAVFRNITIAYYII